ncbi:MAG TPA: hypothetical protein DEA52_06755 [Clostridiaceae bacterium]|nr:hypothetical protein [Clostridiaceae bacterium]
MKGLKLSTKMTWNYALIFTSVLLFINLAVFFSTQLYNRLTAVQEVENLLGRLEEGILRGEAYTEEDLLKEGILFPYYAEIHEGEEILRSLPHLRLIMEEGEVRLQKDLAKGVESSSNLILRTVRAPGKEGLVTLYVLKDLSVFSFMNAVTLVTLLLASIFGIFVSYVVGYYMSKESFRPILAMTKSAAAIGPGNLHDRIDVPEVQDELRELSITFNSLLERMDDAYEKQAKFVSDASHELRTPLTVIKGYNDLLMRWGKKDPEVLEEAITAIRQETDHMSVLVENLLFIAKGETLKVTLQVAPFSMKDLLEETAKDFSLSVPDRKFLVEAEAFKVLQDRRLLKQLLRIFIDNSVKFTKDGGIIKLMAKKTQEGYVLSVCDDGEGIQKEDLEHIFQRFYVGDKARTKDKAGSGLGLSIAKWIVETHEGMVEALSAPKEGTIMRATFPLKALVNEEGQE